MFLSKHRNNVLYPRFQLSLDLSVNRLRNFIAKFLLRYFITNFLDAENCGTEFD